MARKALIFLAPITYHPRGGVAVIYELACAMAQRGHEVHLYHMGWVQFGVESLDAIDWFEFDAPVIHHFAPNGVVEDPSTIPYGDVVFGFIPGDVPPAQPPLPVVLIQGRHMLGTDIEERSYRAPCPKLCVATWLVQEGLDLGVSAHELVHLPLGLRHEKYCVRKPIEDRPRRVTFCYSPHPQKGAQLALETLEQVRANVPDLEVTIFGASAPVHAIPDWMTYRRNPPQEELVDTIYNEAQVLLCTSDVEGFGYMSVEGMACGAALVTTDNGGSRDYAVHGRTALVAPCGDRDALVGQVTSLLQDPTTRVEIATAGERDVRRFRWERTAEILEDFVDRYVADPFAFGRRQLTEDA